MPDDAIDKTYSQLAKRLETLGIRGVSFAEQTPEWAGPWFL
ncbi:hypothetical protein QFZ79_001388 [Arthrobacter sp. V4I6]|nr:hypothetical protein [Arthrobacter sp. V1I7]MDQ0853277.1 hypothetical protein [Arthrobacter sp. V4I6]